MRTPLTLLGAHVRTQVVPSLIICLRNTSETGKKYEITEEFPKFAFSKLTVCVYISLEVCGGENQVRVLLHLSHEVSANGKVQARGWGGAELWGY